MDDVTKIENIVLGRQMQPTKPDGQEYELIGILWECLGCGAVISNTPQHDKMHNKTRSVVD
jgi:hypothetical protein